ncbi:MAG: FAD:protein FMN transferase [Aliiglaciecola sp.]
MINPRIILIPLTLLMLALLLWNKANTVDYIHFSGPTMGTVYNIKVRSDVGPEAAETQEAVDNLLAEINSLMSTYDTSSELSRFNQWRSAEPFVLSEQTIVVLNEAIRLGQLSEGVLDVTVGPLVNLWGFGPQARPEVIPDEQTIASIRQKVGLDKLNVSQNQITKSHPDLYVDLSTIAKGYAVDAVAELLSAYGHQNYLVEIGGEMRVKGVSANDIGWRIAIEKPLTTERDVQNVIAVGDNAVASSGDYRNYFEENGVRYSHLIDPRTGFPIQHNLVAVTVVHPSSMTADGLATALNVMGKDDALRIASENNLDVMLITRENGEFNTYTTGKFEQYIEAARSR